MTGTEALTRPRLVRRRAGHLYGLVVTGSVLAAAPDSIGLARLALALLGTLVVYWAAESYAHWTATRTLLGRSLHGEERREVVADGLPLVAACLVPVAVLLAEAVLGVEPGTGVRIALLTNTALLVGVGWRMATSGGVRGFARVANSVGVGLLGVAMVALKYALHH